jgi:signal peptidase I
VEKVGNPYGESLPTKTVINTALEIWKEQSKQHRISIVGNSMLPLMRDGDRVLVAHASDDFHPGDVIVFWQSNVLVVHRVIRIDHTPEQVHFLTKGDNAPNFDPLVGVEQVIGRVLAVQRGNREIPIDTATWRVLGHWIARSTLWWQESLAIAREIKLHLVGRHPNRYTAWIRQAITLIPSRLFKFWLAVVYRWQE